MELKKYFLVYGFILNREHIKETTWDFIYCWTGPQINNSNHGRSYIRFMENEVKKTSDNILDLIDVGDLVTLSYIDGVFYIQELEPLYLLGMATGVNKDDIVSIYKRQRNGDYKRYEV